MQHSRESATLLIMIRYSNNLALLIKSVFQMNLIRVMIIVLINNIKDNFTH